MAKGVASRRSPGDPALLLEAEARRETSGFQSADRSPSADRPELSGSEAISLSAERNDRGVEIARFRRGRDPVYDPARRLQDSAPTTYGAGRHRRRDDHHGPDACRDGGTDRFFRQPPRLEN